MTAGDERAVLGVHPVAALFPMLADDELADMAADIKERGLLQPITLDGEGRILDGRNRYAACQLAGVEPAFENYSGDDPDGYALATNITRRHLSTGARAIIAAQAARLNGLSIRQAEGGANLYHSRIAEANVVLDYTPELVPQIIAGATPLSVAPREHYMLRVDDDGVITLTPVVVMPVTEADELRGEKGNAA